jgi:hypothetical protein
MQGLGFMDLFLGEIAKNMPNQFINYILWPTNFRNYGLTPGFISRQQLTPSN